MAQGEGAGHMSVVARRNNTVACPPQRRVIQQVATPQLLQVRMWLAEARVLEAPEKAPRQVEGQRQVPQVLRDLAQPRIVLCDIGAEPPQQLDAGGPRQRSERKGVDPERWIPA
jgi:hypothetical protein